MMAHLLRNSLDIMNFYFIAGHGDPEKVDPNLLFDYKAFFARLLPRKLRPARYDVQGIDNRAVEMKAANGNVCLICNSWYCLS